MIPPILFLIAGASGLAFMLSKQKAASNPQPGLAHGSIVCDSGMPTDTCIAVGVAIEVETDSTKLRSFAASIPQYPIAATALLAKANALDALNLVHPTVPNVPIAPPSTPPAIPSIPAIPPAPPAIIPPDLPPAPPPAPVAPPAPAAPEAFSSFDPGPAPKHLPAIPPNGGNKTASHRSVQEALYNFYQNTNVDNPFTGDNWFFAKSDIDGIIGPNTQRALWGFQRYQNGVKGMQLTEDGLPGGNTNFVLQEWGFDPSASTLSNTFVER